MRDHRKKLFHISLSQENKFSYEGEWGHFESLVVHKNVEFSERCSFDYRDIKVLQN